MKSQGIAIKSLGFILDNIDIFAKLLRHLSPERQTNIATTSTMVLSVKKVIILRKYLHSRNQ